MIKWVGLMCAVALFAIGCSKGDNSKVIKVAVSPASPPMVFEKDGKFVDAQQLQELCTQLAAQLTTDDFTSGDTLDANADLLRAALGTYFAPIADAIHNFNFATALDLLRKGVVDHGIRIS
jgi:hypothetical protein